MTPEPPDEDWANFLREADLKPVSDDRVQPWRPKPKPVPRQQAIDDRAVMDELLHGEIDDLAQIEGEHLSFARDGVQHTVLRKLRRGAFAIQAEIDLHGYTVEQAREETAAFLAECVARGFRCVRVIHGKGRPGPEPPRIKHMLSRWLPARRQVLALCSARPEDGGTGALYVLLRKG